MQFQTPLILDDLSSPGAAKSLARLSGKAVGSQSYPELLLQDLIDANPNCLPLQELEPAFANMRAVSRELRLGSDGKDIYIDNLLINPEGRICLVECKLWRNAEAEREVVGQVLAYAAELARLTYEDLADAVRVRKQRLATEIPLVNRVLGLDPSDDARLAFEQGVRRSLRTGAFLLLVVGDRIRPTVQRIATLLEDQAHLAFTFGMVEMAVYSQQNGKGPFYVQPRLLLRTELVTRTVFVAQLPGEHPLIEKVAPATRPATLSENEFYGKLAGVDAGLPDAVRRFLSQCRDVGCETELLRKFNIYTDDGIGGRINVGSIGADGTVEVWGVAVRDTKLQEPIGRRYMDRLAAFLPKARVKDDLPDPSSWNIRVDDKVSIPLSLMLTYSTEWLAAIGALVADLQRLAVRREANVLT